MLTKNWIKKFIETAEYFSSWSKDPSTKVGAVLVDSDNNIRSIGYNGFPRDVSDSSERLQDRNVKYKFTVHAEQNVIATCARLGINTDGCILFCTHHPCSSCLASIIQAGIKTIVIKSPSADFMSRWKEDINISRVMMNEAKITLITVD